MKKFTLFLFIVTLLITGCTKNNEKLDPDLEKQIEDYNWKYSSTDTTYQPNFESDYWNVIDNRYEKMFYEAAVNADFSKNNFENIYLFYNEEANEYSLNTVLQAIQFARLDRPELELMNMDFNYGGRVLEDDNYLYQSISYYSNEYDEYVEKLKEVDKEIEELVNEVNKKDNIEEKHYLIYQWLVSNVQYKKSENSVGIVSFYDGQNILARMNTDSTQNIYGAIVNKEALCDGIADAYKYICNKCNLECIIVEGYISEMYENNFHAWNLVKVNNKWYLIDATWDLGKKNLYRYFMKEDLYIGNRKPFNSSYYLPGYGITDNKLKLDAKISKELLETKVGIEFLIDDIYAMHVIDNTINVNYSIKGINNYVQNKKMPKNIGIKINSKIKSVEYYDSYNYLIKRIDGKDKFIIEIPEKIDDIDVNSIFVEILYKGKTYRVKIEKGDVIFNRRKFK